MVLFRDLVQNIANSLQTHLPAEDDIDLEIFNNAAQINREVGIPVGFEDEYDDDFKIAIINDDEAYLQANGQWQPEFHLFVLADFLGNN